ncbi:MAG: dihydrolipoyl dehydrogenase [Planctomycetota bacterium]|nr:MAG: dihydrolipoyl dehydrogenase [Planctomycetota bacterium]
MSAEVVVIGAGPGGYTAAFYAADLGLEVTLIDKDKDLGGVCLNRGCIPSKFLLHLVGLKHQILEARKWGLECSEVKINLEKIRKTKEKIVRKLNLGLNSLVKSRKIQVLQGNARFLDPHRLEIQQATKTEILEFQNAIIATGSHPSVPNAISSDSSLIWTSDEALELRTIPPRLLVVGGGVIGLELGQVYQTLGSKITIIEMLDQLAPGVDPELVKILEKSLPFEIHTSSQLLSLQEKQDKGQKILLAKWTKGEKEFNQEFDAALIATGRRPNTENLGLSEANIEISPQGFIAVNTAQQTSQPHIYAIGDVVGPPMLAHKASRQARVAVENIKQMPAEFDNRAIPSVIFTDPEVAWVGASEQELKEQNIPYEVGKFPWAASGKALTLHRTEGLCKVLAHRKTKRILGVHLIGAHVSELIAEATLAVEMGAVVEDLSSTIHTHPTLSETIMEACEAIYGVATHIFEKKQSTSNFKNTK